MLFVGTHQHAIDTKQRLAIPSEIRQQLDRRGHGEALYVAVIEGPTLALYTEQRIEDLAAQLDQAQRSGADVEDYERTFFSNAARLEIDKQGRVRLPENLLQIVKLPREVTVVGVNDHMEVHPRDAWQQRNANIHATRPDLFVNPRRILAPGSQSAKRPDTQQSSSS